MPGYRHPCKYCEKLIPEDSNICPICGKTGPLGDFRCPKCKTPIKKDWKVCNNCGQKLEIVCPYCSKATFFGDYCDACGKRLTVICPNKKCKEEQPPLGDKCIKCGKPIVK